MTREPTAGIRDEEELAERIRRARREGRGIRIAGSGGSKSEVTSAPCELVHLDQPDALIATAGDRVTAPASMTTARLQELLAERGLILPTVGEWRNATLAGALVTGTHGGSAHHGIMATSLRGVRMVTGAGAVVEVTDEEGAFGHVGVSLGALGAVTALTFSCVPRFSLEMVTDIVPFDVYRRDPWGQEARTEFHASVWVPSARRVIRFAAERTRIVSSSSRRRARFGRWTAMASFVARRLGWHRLIDSSLLRSRATGDAADILTPLDVPPGLARFRNRRNARLGRRAAELAVPADRATEALERFDALFRQHGGPLNNPIGLRLSQADHFALSPAYETDTLWMDIFHDDEPDFVAELSEIGQSLGARCHWGKALALPVEYLRGRYPRWSEFEALRARVDPDQVFANDFTDLLGLTGTSQRAAEREGYPGDGPRESRRREESEREGAPPRGRDR